MQLASCNELSEICPICRDNLKAEKMVITSCKHSFHESCLTNYFEIGTLKSKMSFLSRKSNSFK